MTATDQNNTIAIDHSYIDMRAMLTILFEKKISIISITICIFIFSMLYVLIKPEEYQASTLLLIQKNQLHHSSKSEGNQTFDLAMLPEESISAKIALIRSNYILDPVIKSLGLDISVLATNESIIEKMLKKSNEKIKITEFFLPQHYLNKKLLLVIDTNNHYQLYYKNNLLISGAMGQRVANAGLILKVDDINANSGDHFVLIKHPKSEISDKILEKLLIINLSGYPESHENESDLLQIKFKDSNPKLIPNILNKITQVYQIKNIERKKRQAMKTLEFLNHQINVTKQSLQNLENSLNRYRSTHGKIDTKLQTEYLMNYIVEIDKKIEEVDLKKLNILEQYTERHPYVIALNDKTKELKKKTVAIV